MRPSAFVGRSWRANRHRYSGRTAMRANSAHEPRQPQDNNSCSGFSRKLVNQPIRSRDSKSARLGAGLKPPQAWNKFRDEVGGKLRHGDPGVRLIEATEGGLIISLPCRQASVRRTVSGVLRRITNSFGSDELFSVLRSSRAVCRSRISNLTRRMPRSWASRRGRASPLATMAILRRRSVEILKG